MEKTKNQKLKKLKKVSYIGSIFCNFSVIDQETNNLSVFNIIEEINIPSSALKESVDKNLKDTIKVIPMVVELITLWRKLIPSEEVNGRTKVELIDPEKKVLQIIDNQLSIKSEHKTLRNRIRMSGIKVSKSGEYKFRVSASENGQEYIEVGFLSFNINIHKPQPIKSVS